MAVTNQINVMDPRSLGGLKQLARENGPEAIRAAAQQFEALFLQMTLKSMRDATPPNDMFDSEQSRMYQSMLDQQLAMNMSQSRGIGLADALVRQFGGSVGPAPGAGEATGEGVPLDNVLRQAANAAGLQSLPELAEGLAARRALARATELREKGSEPVAQAALPAKDTRSAKRAAPPVRTEAATAAPASVLANVPASARQFVDRMWPHAVEASRATGIPARFLVAHAALETGWGRAELRHADGRPSYNLFNIKAGKGWNGDAVSRATTEYAHGRPRTEQAAFRSYGSYAEAFKDYARLLTESPRYGSVVGQKDAAGFARGLQKAGYATDPMYAQKIERIINGNTMRVALANVDPSVA